MRFSGAYVIMACALACACTYAKRGLCEDDVCRAADDNPPVAVIADVGNDGALLVGGGSDVIVDGSKSSDPDGDVITFAWTVDSACKATVVGDATASTIRLSGLAVGSTCTVGLTVTDTSGLTGSASATLVVANIGAYVTSNQASCMAVFDPASTSAQGTADTPFCQLAMGLEAAKSFHLAEASLDTGVHLTLGALSIDFSTSVRGGYTRAAGAWSHSDGSTSDVEMHQDPSTANGDALLAIADGVVVTLGDLAVYRLGACRADCATVTAGKSNVTINNVAINDNRSRAQPPSASDGGGHNTIGFSMVGPDAGSSTLVQLTTTSFAVFGMANAASSECVDLRGNVQAALGGFACTATAAPIVVGVRLVATASMIADMPVVQLSADGSADSAAYGIVDGNRNSVSPFTTACDSTDVCGGSQHISISRGEITVDTAVTAIGVATLGTKNVDLQGVGIAATGQHAWGVLLSAAGSDDGELTMTGLSVSATTQSVVASGSSFAIGIGDNFAGAEATPGLGSNGINVQDSVVQVNVGDGLALVQDAIGICLEYSVSPNVSDVDVAIGGLPGTTITDVIGVFTYATEDAVITDSSVVFATVSFSDGAAGFADGIFNGGPGSDAASENTLFQRLGVTGSVYAIADTSVGASISAAHSNGFVLSGDYGQSYLSLAVDGGAGGVGVFLSQTQNSIVRGNDIDVSSSTPTTILNSGLYVGLLDGSPVNSDVTLGSTNLLVTGNRITVKQDGSDAIGVVLRGSGGSSTFVDDNFIVNPVQNDAIGVLAQSSSVIVQFNSVRNHGSFGGDDPTGGYTVGVYAMDPPGHDGVAVFANSFNTMTSVPTETRPAIVWHDFGTTFAKSAFGPTAGNIWGDEADTDTAQFVVTINDSGTTVISPVGFSGFDGGSFGSHNQPLTAVYCPDGLHGDPTGPQVQYATADDVPHIVANDIDDEARSAAPYDAGADRIHDTCP